MHRELFPGSDGHLDAVEDFALAADALRSLGYTPDEVQAIADDVLEGL